MVILLTFIHRNVWASGNYPGVVVSGASPITDISSGLPKVKSSTVAWNRMARIIKWFLILFCFFWLDQKKVYCFKFSLTLVAASLFDWKRKPWLAIICHGIQLQFNSIVLFLLLHSIMTIYIGFPLTMVMLSFFLKLMYFSSDLI